MTAIPILIFWALVIWGFRSPRPALIYLFFATLPFGSMAVLPPGITAGLTFTPTPIVALFIILRSLGSQRGMNFVADAGTNIAKLGLLALFWIVALLTTIFMPRLFAGSIDIIPVRGILNSASPLYPTSQNISQLTYMTISIVTVFAFARILQPRAMRQHALQGLCLAAFVAIVTGILDYATQFVPIAVLLEPFRTATYALLTEVEVLGGKRVIGLMPEASSYGGLCLTLLTSLYFMRRAIADDWLRDRIVPWMLGALLLLTWLSTSSSALVGLGVLGVLVVLEWGWRFVKPRLSSRNRSEIKLEFWIAFGALTFVTAVLLFVPSLLDPIVALIDRMVLQKTTSHSYEERGMWTAVSWQAALDSYGIGVGLGSTRPSNTFVAVVSSTGFLGAALYYGFIALTLMRRAHPQDAEGQALLHAVRWSFPPLFLIGLLVGTGADIGAFGAFRYGLASAVGLAWYDMGRQNRRTSAVGFRRDA